MKENRSRSSANFADSICRLVPGNEEKQPDWNSLILYQAESGPYDGTISVSLRNCRI